MTLRKCIFQLFVHKLFHLPSQFQVNQLFKENMFMQEKYLIYKYIFQFGREEKGWVKCGSSSTFNTFFVFHFSSTITWYEWHHLLPFQKDFPWLFSCLLKFDCPTSEWGKNYHLSFHSSITGSRDLPFEVVHLDI